MNTIKFLNDCKKPTHRQFLVDNGLEQYTRELPYFFKQCTYTDEFPYVCKACEHQKACETYLEPVIKVLERKLNEF